jgi:quercetin dioxygenase-like cupin family protein
MSTQTLESIGRHPRRLVALVAAVAVAVVVGSLLLANATAVHADHGLPHGTILARGTFADATDVQIRTEVADKHRTLNVQDSDEVIVQNVTIAALAHTGWHSHHGPVVVVVAAGTMTLYQGDDPSCTPHVYTAGQVFVDPGQGNVHIARNEDRSVGVVLLATYFDVPAGAGPAIAHANPGHCTGF